jgi:cobalt/nickel transport protein
MKRENWWILGLVGAIAITPLFVVRSVRGNMDTFGGVDDKSADLIGELRPGYVPWATPMWKPPSTEIESTLFGLQAALGAAVLGYCLGYLRGRRAERNSHAALD